MTRIPPAASGVLFSAERVFRLWRYGVGHSQLLIRALPDTTSRRCLDLHFEGVAAVRLAVRYDTMSILVASGAAADDMFELGQVEDRWRREYVALLLRGSRKEGYVLCRSVRALLGGIDAMPTAAEEVVWTYRNTPQ